jgi:serine/threonine protein phosphatase PrpC
LKEFVIGRPYLSSTVVNIEKSIIRSNEGIERRNAPFTDGEFLIVACDGLWDVVDDQEAVDLVRNFVDVSDNTEDNKRERSARFLIDEALRRGSTDNITVIVYWL